MPAVARAFTSDAALAMARRVTGAATTFPFRLALMAGLLALMVRAMIPAGFMLAPPGQGAAGPIPIVLCTEGGTIQALMAADGSIVEQGDVPADDTDHSDAAIDHAACVFAQGAAVPAPAELAATVTLSARVDAGPSGAVALDLVPGRGLAAPPPPATAPPVLI